MTEQTKRIPRGRYGENLPEKIKEFVDKRFNKRVEEHIQDQEHLDEICAEAIEQGTFPLFRIGNTEKISVNGLFICEKVDVWDGYVLWNSKAVTGKSWNNKHLSNCSSTCFVFIPPSIVFRWDNYESDKKKKLPYLTEKAYIEGLSIKNLYYVGYNYNPEIDYQETPVTITIDGFEYKIWQVGLRWMRNHPGWVIGSWWYEPQGDFNYGEPGASCSIRGCDSYQDAVDHATKFEKAFKVELTKARIPKKHRRKSYGWPNMDRLRKGYDEWFKKEELKKEGM